MYVEDARTAGQVNTITFTVKLSFGEMVTHGSEMEGGGGGVSIERWQLKREVCSIN